MKAIRNWGMVWFRVACQSNGTDEGDTPPPPAPTEKTCHGESGKGLNKHFLHVAAALYNLCRESSEYEGPTFYGNT